MPATMKVKTHYSKPLCVVVQVETHALLLAGSNTDTPGGTISGGHEEAKRRKYFFDDFDD